MLAKGFSLAHVQAPQSFHNQTLAELHVGSRYKVLVVAFRRTVEETDESGQTQTHEMLISAPGPTSVIEPGDVLVLIGSDEAIEAFPTQ